MSVQGIWSRCADWLFKQRTETVVLLLILGVAAYFAGRGLPWAMTEVKSHIDSINVSHERQIDRLTETFDKAHEREYQTINRLLDSKGVGDGSSAYRQEFAVSPSVRPYPPVE